MMMAESESVGPAKERIELLDALRGFAIFGILMANIVDWSGWQNLPDGQQAALAGASGARAYDFLIAMFVEGKFYTIFSFLFGLGFALQLSRLERRGVDGIRIYRRRLAILLAIGLLHMSLVWDGDILALYAAIGFVLPFIRSWSDRRLLIGAGILIALPIPGGIVAHFLGAQPGFGLNQVGDSLFVAMGGDPKLEVNWRAREDWGSYFAWALSGPPFRIGGLLASWRIPKVLAIMMLGLWAGRRLIAGALFENRTLLKRIAIVGFLIGLPANFAFAANGGLDQETFRRGLIAFILYAIGVVPLGLAYAASFALAWPRAKAVLGLLAPPGRMALTNYLMQSALGITIFYGVGFGLFHRLNPVEIVGVAVAIFASQVVISRLWLNWFEQGPMEALWRQLTYARYNSRHDEVLAAR
jgi:uncharacterized protein